jgi:hypothetical protein
MDNGAYVADVTIPPFQKLPEVVVWGERFFGFHKMLDEPEDPCAAEYRQVFAYCIVPEVRDATC